MSSTAAPQVRLPNGAHVLLEAFARLNPAAELRVWVQRDGARIPVFPEGAADGAAPATARHTLAWEDGAELTLEATGPVDDAAVAFLAEALSRTLTHEDEARSAARELSEKYEEINLLYSISEILGSVLTLEAAAGRILSEVADVLGAKRATLWVYEPDSQSLVPAAAVGDTVPRTRISIHDPDSATALVFRENQPLSLERGAVLPRDRHIEPRPQGREPFLSVPVNYTPPEGNTRTVGVITLVGRRSNDRFTAGDGRLLAAIASQVGSALETQRLVQESLRQERVMREMELAHDLQLKLLPDTSVFEGTADVAARCVPAESVGGDFYHLFRLPGGRLGVIIGDVSSHGFSAALIMALTMSAVAIHASEGDAPAEVLRRTHLALIDELETTEMYLTLFYGVIDPARGEITFANAGHSHAFRITASGEAERLSATDPPFGIIDLDRYREEVRSWAAGEDLLFLFTDGLSDALERGEVEGERILVDEVAGLRDRPADEIIRRLFTRVGEVGATVPPDDRT
ncbi:MAG TPA: GAF domain-containing SpoIIE family protein phosphatase, partial [Longimicrobiales bacterium]|nr:GAF domain-containing SpoIIE family protein phosphatase [Longimicrobiales bacterium]